MNSFSLIFQNKVLITALIGWACSQILKPFTFMIVNKRFDASRLTGDGGMPSSHSTCSRLPAPPAVPMMNGALCRRARGSASERSRFTAPRSVNDLPLPR